MITPTQLELLAQKYHIDIFTIMREYLQLTFLSYLYAHKSSKHIYFKGGTAIRLLEHSPRFSEDLDFSSTLPKSQIQQIISVLATKLSKELPHLAILPLYSGKTGIRYHLTYNSPDFKYPFNLRLDFTLVAKVIDPTISPLITDFPITIFPIISHLSNREVLAEKICALLSRTKGRDYYDTWYLLEKGVVLNPKILQQKLRENNLILQKDLFFKRILSYSQKNLALDLAQFLPKSQKQVIPILLSLLHKKLSESLLVTNYDKHGNNRLVENFGR